MSGRSWKWMEWQPKAAKLEPLAHNAISQQFCATAIGSNNSQAGIGIGSRQSNNILNAKGKRRVVTETLHMQGAALSDLKFVPLLEGHRSVVCQPRQQVEIDRRGALLHLCSDVRYIHHSLIVMVLARMYCTRVVGC